MEIENNEFNDPLEDIDPIMEQAFSAGEDDIESSPKDNRATPVSRVQFPDLNKTESGKKINVEEMYNNIPINISVELGRANITMKEVYEITEGSIIELEKCVGEPLDLVVNGQILAQGEVVAIDNNYGIRLTNIVANIRKK